MTLSTRHWHLWSEKDWLGYRASLPFLLPRSSFREVDGIGRSFLMSVLDHGIAHGEVDRVFEKALSNKNWAKMLRHEDHDGVRLPAYIVRFSHLGNKELFEKVWESFCPQDVISSRGEGLLLQLSRLAVRIGSPWELLNNPTSLRRHHHPLPQGTWNAGFTPHDAAQWALGGLLLLDGLGPWGMSYDVSLFSEVFYPRPANVHGYPLAATENIDWGPGLHDLAGIVALAGFLSSIPGPQSSYERDTMVKQLAEHWIHLGLGPPPPKNLIVLLLSATGLHPHEWGVVQGLIESHAACSGLCEGTAKIETLGEVRRL